MNTGTVWHGGLWRNEAPMTAAPIVRGMYRPPSQSQQAESLLRQQWTTAKELARAIGVHENHAGVVIRRLSWAQPVFCRKRIDAKYRPKEYRILKRAVNVRLVPVL